MVQGAARGSGCVLCFSGNDSGRLLANSCCCPASVFSDQPSISIGISSRSCRISVFPATVRTSTREADLRLDVRDECLLTEVAIGGGAGQAGGKRVDRPDPRMMTTCECLLPILASR